MAQTATKQDVFTWEGTDRRGSKMQGEIRATTPALAKAELRRQGVTPKKVAKKRIRRRKQAITSKDLSVFLRQLSTMVAAGVPIVQALEIQGRGQANPSMAELLNTIRGDVEAGTTLHQSLAKHPYYFDRLVCNLVEAGEQAGVLDTLLDKIATYKEKTEALKSKIKKAMFYPSAVMVVAVIVTAILLIFVVPQFQSLFANFGADLPAFTLMVIGMSEFMQSYWWLVFGILAGAVVGFIQARKRSPRFVEFLDRLFLKMPVFGPLVEKAAIARYARTLSTMFAAGVPLVDSLDSVSGATGNVVFGNAILQMRDQVSTGTQLQLAMGQTGLFPNMVVQMVAIGEESGSLDKMLSKVAEFYEQEVDDAVDGLSSLMEPLIMAVLGVLVGGLVIAMYLPIFKLGAVI